MIQGPAWFDLLAAGYAEGKASLEEGFDCRTLVGFYLRRLGRRVPSHPFWDGDTLQGADEAAGPSGEGVADFLEQVPDYDLRAPELGLVLELPPVNRRVGYRHMAICCSEQPALFLNVTKAAGVHVLRPHQVVQPIRAWRARA